MNSATTDLDLVRQAKSGDSKAFDMLMVKYQDKLKSVVSRYLKLPQQIEDVVQEAFIKAYSGIMSFREDSKFSTWLHRIGVNTALCFLAVERRRIPHYQSTFNADTNEPLVPEISDTSSPEQVLESSQIAETVSNAFEKLPRDLREAITLREIDGLNYEEIANIMDCPIGTVRSRIFRARESIAARLRPQLDPNPKSFLQKNFKAKIGPTSTYSCEYDSSVGEQNIYKPFQPIDKSISNEGGKHE